MMISAFIVPYLIIIHGNMALHGTQHTIPAFRFRWTKPASPHSRNEGALPRPCSQPHDPNLHVNFHNPKSRWLMQGKPLHRCKGLHAYGTLCSCCPSGRGCTFSSTAAPQGRTTHLGR